MAYSFFAFTDRMKHINRWGLMRNMFTENLQEHAYQTAVLAHALALLQNTRCGGNVNAERAALLAMYHDTTEIITGDLPTPVKYFNDDIRKSYGQIEAAARETLLDKLPDDLKPVYAPLLQAEDAPEWVYVKAADTLSAYIKCMDELKAGNTEFSAAKRTLEAKLHENPLPCLKIFMDEFLPSYTVPLDEQ